MNFFNKCKEQGHSLTCQVKTLKKLPVKLPIDSITRPWSGYNTFFKAFYSSFDEIEEISVHSSKFNMPTNKTLIGYLKGSFEDFESFFKNLQISTKPSLFHVVLELFKIELKMKDWPNRMHEFSRLIKISLEKKYCTDIKMGHLIGLFLQS